MRISGSQSSPPLWRVSSRRGVIDHQLQLWLDDRRGKESGDASGGERAGGRVGVGLRGLLLGGFPVGVGELPARNVGIDCYRRVSFLASASEDCRATLQGFPEGSLCDLREVVYAKRKHKI